jgi:hypothetical protein
VRKLSALGIDRVVDGALLHIRLAEDDDPGPLRSLEETLHRRQLGRLELGDLNAFSITGRPQLEDAGDQSDDHAHAPEKLSLPAMLAHEQVVSAEACQRERAGDHRAAHGVGVLGQDQELKTTAK